jgi:hypothetical protein
MPEPIQFFVKHFLIGLGLAAVFVSLLVWMDVNGLRGMLAKDEMWLTALLALWFGIGSVFGALQVAYAVMDKAERGD